MSESLNPRVKIMTSEAKTLAFLARRVSSLERSLETLSEVVASLAANQAEFKPIIQGIFDGIQKNGTDHHKILEHLGIE